ncbi:hypothetical protein BGZ57DRAFT_887393 [Hyaloscypha finlandica]|nr:hypothetical protein BGZ57DRAFT_887393 [Hyaloscypha finlandica]
MKEPASIIVNAISMSLFFLCAGAGRPEDRLEILYFIIRGPYLEKDREWFLKLAVQLDVRLSITEKEDVFRRMLVIEEKTLHECQPDF